MDELVSIQLAIDCTSLPRERYQSVRWPNSIPETKSTQNKRTQVVNRSPRRRRPMARGRQLPIPAKSEELEFVAVRPKGEEEDPRVWSPFAPSKPSNRRPIIARSWPRRLIGNLSRIGAGSRMNSELRRYCTVAAGTVEPRLSTNPEEIHRPRTPDIGLNSGLWIEPF